MFFSEEKNQKTFESAQAYGYGHWPRGGSGGASMDEVYDGSCHCGRVKFRVTADLDTVSYCNCSICAKKGFLHLIVEKAQFQLLAGESELAWYTFNTRVAKHTFCKTCGIHAFYTPRSHPDKIDVNARCLDGIDPAALRPYVFDGRNWEAAMETWPLNRPE
jgi:hypothetical protein